MRVRRRTTSRLCSSTAARHSVRLRGQGDERPSSFSASLRGPHVVKAQPRALAAPPPTCMPSSLPSGPTPRFQGVYHADIRTGSARAVPTCRLTRHGRRSARNGGDDRIHHCGDRTRIPDANLNPTAFSTRRHCHGRQNVDGGRLPSPARAFRQDARPAVCRASVAERNEETFISDLPALERNFEPVDGRPSKPEHMRARLVVAGDDRDPAGPCGGRCGSPAGSAADVPGPAVRDRGNARPRRGSGRAADRHHHQAERRAYTYGDGGTR